jgi:uncharacterized protein YggE
VLPKNRNSNASIAAAYERARTASIAGALKQAHEYAEDYAKAVQLKLGGVISVSDAQGQKPRLKTVHRCFVPRSAFITLSVTYSAS